MIDKMANFEISQQKMGCKVYGDSLGHLNYKSYGAEYYVNLGMMEGLVFDVHGKPHPTLHGQIATEGKFPAGAIEKMHTWHAKPKPQPRQHGLSYIFLKSTKHVDNLDQFIGAREETAKWETLKDALSKVTDRAFSYTIAAGYEADALKRYQQNYDTAKSDLTKARRALNIKDSALNDQLDRFVSETDLAVVMDHARRGIRSNNNKMQQWGKGRAELALKLAKKLGMPEAMTGHFYATIIEFDFIRTKTKLETIEEPITEIIGHLKQQREHLVQHSQMATGL